MPDEETPATKYFCVTIKRMITGTIAIDAPASCIGIFAPPLSWKNFKAGVINCFEIELINR